MIKVMVVDDHDLVRSGIARMLEDVEGIRVIATAASGEEAIRLVRDQEPDVLLMDIKMPGIGGLEATRKLLRNHDALRIIAVTACEEEPYPSRILRAGAVGYLSKGADLDEVLRAIRVVHAGQRYISPEVATSMAFKPYQADNSPFELLSEREMQILMLIVTGQKVQNVSDRLCLSPKTVNTYRYRIFEKLNITSDVEMTLLALRHGLLQLQDED